MPVLAIPLLAGAVGFGAGFWTGSTTSKLIKLAAVGGGCYVAYKVVKGGK
ncbi:hypothetical protein [Photobacterium proteolyticum]|nr:hypothetical protein [Photobacterium proteolyticum]